MRARWLPWSRRDRPGPGLSDTIPVRRQRPIADVAPRSTGGFGRSVTRGCVAPGPSFWDLLLSDPWIVIPWSRPCEKVDRDLAPGLRLREPRGFRRAAPSLWAGDVLTQWECHPSPHPGLLAENGTAAGESSVRPRPSPNGSPRQVWLALGFVILVFVALASIIAIRTPAWESADEPDHVYNIETLASGHWYGINTRCRNLSTVTTPSCRPRETQQAPLYYLIMAAWQKAPVGLPPRPLVAEQVRDALLRFLQPVRALREPPCF